MLGSNDILPSLVVDELKMTADPKVILVPETDPNLAVPRYELLLSLYDTTNLPATLGSNETDRKAVLVAWNKTGVAKLIVVPEIDPIVALP